MAKILFIANHRPNRSPSQRYRFEQYFDILKSAGHQLEFSWILNEKDDQLLYQKGNFIKKALLLKKAWSIRRKDIKRATEFDVVFIQREAILGASTYFEKKFYRSGAKVIFDFDDSIWKLDISDANRWFGFLKNPSKTAILIKNAHQIVAGNDYLANYAKKFNPHVSVIPTTIDTNTYQPKLKKQNNQIIIGWTGSHTTIKHFKLAESFLKKLKLKYGDKIAFKVIGDSEYKNKELGIIGLKWKSETETEDLSQIDIGIMPLPDDEWTKGKCGLKGLQYMALGIPTVMSAVGVNTKIIDHGKNGFLAITNLDWIEYLSKLIENPELRSEIGKSALNTIQSEYSVIANQNKYLNLIKSLTES